MFKFRIYVADDALNSTQAIANLASPSLTTSLPPATFIPDTSVDWTCWSSTARPAPT